MSEKKYKRGAAGNKIRSILKRERFDKVVLSYYPSYSDFHQEFIQEYGLDIGYKNFSALITNTNNWSLTYAMCLCDKLNQNLDELFVFEHIN